jgi:flagella basal body P-ring formation protein FlgA
LTIVARIPPLILMAIACLPLLAHAGDTACRIRLQPDAKLAARTVVLADVADIAGPEAAKLQPLKGLRVAALSAPGQPLRMTRQRLRHVIDTALPAYRDACVLEGASTVTVTWSGAQFDVDAMLAWAGDALLASLRTREPEAEIRLTPQARPSVPAFLPQGQVSYALRPSSLPLTARMPAQVDVLVNGSHAATLSLWFQVSGTMSAWRMRVTAAAGAVLQPDMLHLERIAIPAEPVMRTAFARPVAQRLTVVKEAGAVLYARDIVERKAVEPGDQVAVRIVRGAVAIEDSAIALGPGMTGSEVRLRNPRTHETYAATVISAGVAEAR